MSSDCSGNADALQYIPMSFINLFDLIAVSKCIHYLTSEHLRRCDMSADWLSGGVSGWFALMSMIHEQ
jgi:hypothetical protein